MYDIVVLNKLHTCNNGLYLKVSSAWEHSSLEPFISHNSSLPPTQRMSADRHVLLRCDYNVISKGPFQKTAFQ